MSDLFDELGRLFRRDTRYGSDLDPLGELVHRHEDVLVATKGGSEWPY
jgi:hypothetical protein